MHATRLALSGALALATLAAATAQDAAEPIAPHLVVESAGPSGWRTLLGPTNLGNFLDRDEVRELWQPQTEMILGYLPQLLGDNADVDATRERLFAFDGLVRLAVLFDDDEPRFAALSVRGDDADEVAAFTNDLHRLLLAGRDMPRIDVEVAGQSRPARQAGRDVLTEPILDGTNAKMLLSRRDGLDVAAGLAAYLDARPITLANALPGTPALTVHVDVDALIPATEMGEDMDIVKALGLDVIDDLTLTLRAAGPLVEFDCDVRFSGPRRSLVAGLMPESTGVSRLATLVPDGTLGWSVSRCNLAAVFEGILDAIETEVDDPRAEMKKEIGFDLEADMLAHLSDELMVIGEPFDRPETANWSIVFRLPEAEPFRTSLDKLMKAARPLITPLETVDAAGVPLRAYGLLAYTTWMGAGNGLFVIGAGRDAEQQLTAMLTRAKELDFDAEVEQPFRDLTRHLPPGLQGVSRIDLDQVLAGPTDLAILMMEEMLMPQLRGPQIDAESAAAAQEKLRELLKEYSLSTWRTASGSEDGVWRWRLFW